MIKIMMTILGIVVEVVLELTVERISEGMAKTKL